jgi:hypothetical protein
MFNGVAGASKLMFNGGARATRKGAGRGKGGKGGWGRLVGGREVEVETRSLQMQNECFVYSTQRHAVTAASLLVTAASLLVTAASLLVTAASLLVTKQQRLPCLGREVG